MVTTPPAVVTTIFFAPTVPAGVFAAIEVAVATTLVAAMPPTVTVAPVNLVPAMVIVVPAASGPDVGDTLAIVGSATYVNALALVVVPPMVVTATLCAPAVPAGVFAVIEVAVATTLVAAVPPIFTVAPIKLVPVIVIVVPPATGPEIGATVVMVGRATYVNAAVLVATPPAVVTTTSLAPTKPAGVFAVIEVAVATTLVAAVPPIFTVAPIKLVPAIVIDVPAVSGPDVGETLAMVGSAT